ncbi:MAG: AbrB/MazE/SpoVT family DNA-binding domain-containing protein [Thaumarchaeota archaeon]|nr:AbrB/MazE/SpoVT family DNA-binding domain-containing protein [Nitrososphaerota archaeon]
MAAGSEVGVSPVSEKGQVTIPKEIRDSLKLKKGDRVVFLEVDEHVVLRKAKSERLSEALQSQRPWKEGSLLFQRRLRKEWD